MPPVFFWNLAESDARRGTETSRTFIRMLTNILLYLAAVDDDVTYAEAAYITDCTDRLTAICDTTGVRKSRDGLNPLDFVTSGEPSFQDKHKPQVQTTGGETKLGLVSDDIIPGAHVQVIGIAEHDLCLQIMELGRRNSPLDGGSSGHIHKNRCFNGAVDGFKTAAFGTSAGF